MNPQHGTLQAAQKLTHDPWSLSLPERLDLLAEHAQAQHRWLQILVGLVEPPAPTSEFPAFLLATPPFARLRAAIANARSTHDLDTATADELQRFVDCYRNYLNADVEVTTASARPSGPGRP